ncbi:MAG: hypothetical protein GY835_01650 [bacterium]|nr:hypothetical protein [bacterium]
MSSFVINFMNESKSNFQGKVRHVGSGEEISFATVMELLNFFEEMTLGSEIGIAGSLSKGVESAETKEAGE